MTHKRVALLAGLALMLVFALGFVGTATGETTVTSCGTLDQDYEKYVLESNLSLGSGTSFECLEIAGDNIVLDGQGHTLSSNAGSFSYVTAITVAVDSGTYTTSPSSDVKIRNITLEGWKRSGIYLRGDRNVIENVEINNAGAIGIDISAAYVDSTNTVKNTVIDGVSSNTIDSGYGIEAEGGSSGTSNTYTNVTVRNTDAAELRADNDNGDTLMRYNVSGNLTTGEANGVDVKEPSSVPSAPAAVVSSLDTYIGVEDNGNGYLDKPALFYDSTSVPGGKIAAIWYHNSSSWERLDNAKLGISTGKDFVRADRNVTEPPTGSVLGVFASDILPIDANFTTEPTDPIEGQFIKFDANSSNSPNDEIVEYRWDFGDGTTVNTTSPTVEHSYDTDGSYTVTLEIEDGIGEVNTTTRTVTVDRAERYYAGGDGATRTYQIANWTHLDNVREVPSGNFELVNDLDNGTDGYDTVARANETDFTDEFGTVYVTPDEVTLNRAPVDPGSISTTDLGDGSNVSYNVTDAQNGTVELTETTDGNVRISYSTQSPILVGFDSIGNLEQPFEGDFDGNGYVISDLFVERYGVNVGLFGVVGGNGTLKNVELTDANVTVLGDFNQDNTGTLVGYNNNGTVENSSANGTVDAQSNVGGLVGYSNGGTVRDSSADVDITAGYSTVGGLVGRLVGFSKPDSSYPGTVERSSATGDIKGDSSAIGGLVGEVRDSSTVSGSYATGNVSPISGGSITRSGGLVGELTSGTITNSYAVVNITGGNDIGGLVGRNSDVIEYSYAAGNVNSSDGGGVAGDSALYSSTVTDSYWDVNATGQDTTSYGDGTGLVTEEMKGNRAEVNMSGFDFANTWNTVSRALNNSTQEIAYPVLRNNTQIPEPGLERIVATDNFTVVIDNFTAVVRPGDEVSVNATLENVGLGSGTQTVEFTVNGTVESSTSVSLDSLETETVGFNYTATDADKPKITVGVVSENDSAIRNVTIGNAPPEANADSYTVQEGSKFSASEPGVLGNDTDANGDTLSVAGVVSEPSNGTLNMYANGSFEYTPYPGFTGKDTFEYEATDGNETDTANVTLNVLLKDLRSITYGETKPGRIDDTDPSGFRGEYEPVTFGGAAGDNITVTMTSSGDTYLILLAPNGSQIASNDDASGLGLNSRIKNFVLPDTGSYTIIATSYYDTARFKYNLTLEANSRNPGNFSASVNSTNSPVTEGEVLEALADVQNTAGSDGSQRITLTDPDFNEVDSQQVALGAGNSTTVALNWTTQPGDAGTGDILVTSDNDTASETVQVESDPSSTGQADLSIGSFAGQFPDAGVGFDYGNASIPVEETNDNETQNLNVTLEIDGAGSTFTFSGSNTTATLQNESKNFTFAVGGINQSDTYTATVTANATNANKTTRTAQFNVTSSPFFDVNITDTNSPVNETENLTADVKVTNTGTGNGTQMVTLNDSFNDDLRRDSTSLTLNVSESKNTTLSWSTGSGDGGAGSVTVSSENTTDTANVTVRALASFDMNITDTNLPVDENEVAKVEVNVTNEGDTKGTETIELVVDGEVVDNETVTLGPGESSSITLKWQTDSDDTGSISIAIEGASETKVLSFEVDGLLGKRDAGRGELNETRDPSREMGRGENGERDDLYRDSGRNTNSNRRDRSR